MKQKTVAKLSVLGLILLIASAITAAVLPEESNDLKQVNSAENATLCSLSGIACGFDEKPQSCVPDKQNDLIYSCHLTIATETTGGSIESDAPPTVGNTSHSEQGPDHEGDTTSKV